MDLALLQFLGMNLNTAFASASRPGLTFFFVQVLVGGLVRLDLVALPDRMAWMVSLPAILIAMAFAALETIARHDGSVSSLLHEMHLEKAVSCFGALTSSLLFVSLGMPEAEAAALGEPGQLHDLALTLTAASESGRHPAVVAAVVASAVGFNAGLAWLRAQIVEFLHDDELLMKIWARIETGGVVGLLILLPLLPLVSLAFVLLCGLVLLVVALIVHKAEAIADKMGRVPCGSCSYSLRPEASACPACGAQRAPTRWLDQPSSLGQSWEAALQRLRGQPRADIAEREAG